MAHDANSDAHAQAGHVVPLWLLAGVFGTLVILTWATVAVTRFDFGQLNIWVAIAIAAIKATLVALYFMHLRWDRPFNGVVLLISLVLLVLFLGLALRDGIAYMPDQIPGYAPEINR
jgi:cytochrome c oxidase subunit 4